MKNKSVMNVIIVVIVVAIVAVCAFLVYHFTSSNSNSSSSIDESIITKYTADDTIDVSSEYGVSYIDVPDGMMDRGLTYFCRDNKLIHLNNLMTDENGVRDHSVTIYNIEEETFTKIDLDFSEITSNELVLNHFAPYLEDEYVALVCDRGETEDYKEYQYYIAILDSDFQLERYSEIQLEGILYYIAADDEGYIAICDAGGTDEKYPVRVYDSEFNLVLTEDYDGFEFVVTVNNKIAFGYFYDSSSCYLCIYNSETNAFDYSIIPSSGRNRFVEYGTDTIVYISYDGEICTYGIGDDYITKIIDMTQYGVEMSNTLYRAVSLGDTFFFPILENDEETGVNVITQWAVISKDAEDDDRQQLTYAVTGSYPSKAVSDFNRQNTEYFIKVVDYSDEDGLERLEKEIISGNIPDILDCSDIDVKAYVEKGVLCDISDVADTVGILDVFVNAMEMDGGLYDLPYEYQIGYIFGRTSILPNTTEYTADEIREIIEENDITYLFESMLGYDFVLDMIRGNEEYYLTTGASAFAEDEFVSILSLIKDYGFSNNSFNSAVDQIVTLSFENGDYLFSYGLVVDYATVGEMSKNESEYFATGVTLDGVTDPALLMTVTFGMTSACQSEDAFAQFAELVYDDKVTALPLTENQLSYTESAEDTAGETLAFIENAAVNGVQRNYCGYSSIIEDEIERMIDQNINPSKIASEIQEKMSIYINEQAE